jgi:small subunit ribosomal protein S1
VGRKLRMKVIEINRRRNRVILSERAAMQEWRAEQKDRLLSELREGEVRRGTITSIRSFGVFVDLGGADGLVHLSELSWERDIDPEAHFKVGQDVDVYVMKVDSESKKIGLSIRRAQPEQWDDVVAEYQVGQVAAGQVTKLVTFGAFVRIDGPVEGLIHVSELVDRRISHPREVVGEGDVVPVKIVRIERDRHRLGLSLRQARVEAERDGWIFNEDGGIAWIPPAIAERFGVEQGEPPPPPPEPAAPAESSQDEDEAARTPVVEEKPQTAMEAALERAGLSESDLVADEPS